MAFTDYEGLGRPGMHPYLEPRYGRQIAPQRRLRRRAAARFDTRRPVRDGHNRPAAGRGFPREAKSAPETSRLVPYRPDADV